MFSCRHAEGVRIGLMTLVMLAIGQSPFAGGEEPSVHSRQLKALADCEARSQNYAVLMRMQYNKLAADASQSSSHVEYTMGVRASGRSTGGPRKELWFKSSYRGGMSQSGEFSVEKSSELYAISENRTFVGNNTGVNGGEIRDEFSVREVTEQIESDDAIKESAELFYRRLQIDPLALPFLSISSIVGRDVDFSRIRTIMRNWKVEYETQSETEGTVVWVGSKRNAAATYLLEREFDYLPTKVCVYTRPVSEKRLVAGDALGELLYRTTTQWSKIEVGAPGERKSRSQQGATKKSVWLPTRIVLEEAPKSELHMLEIDCQWKLDIDPKLISPDALLGRIQPNPISELYEELSIELDETLQANSQKSRKPQ